MKEILPEGKEWGLLGSVIWIAVSAIIAGFAYPIYELNQADGLHQFFMGLAGALAGVVIFFVITKKIKM